MQVHSVDRIPILDFPYESGGDISSFNPEFAEGFG